MEYVKLVKANLHPIQSEVKRWKKILYPKFQKHRFVLQS